ncbi:uncharacterized protein SPPG_08941 [Spizellomyces punctatus DAOM BR117]|uniref:Sorting nexin MVP1 n=1 Tax=Spizellomyces punctatus (strain DAOM BR117) TaxID=645134 RepID=A0A0L0HRW8_SPIPD|nr:uncharacterized protein SPPG_08941 [Spizellomyces punctatus DAOM BR117]KND04096.1 hypothetical protein SPPG_08941 [Spizellomyces punctatus DAOM BR117]|eukprot:XP_016612135.1 hypothetical protein SPPG_08941 [Spizellomyces punctatus DAOM BR117]
MATFDEGTDAAWERKDRDSINSFSKVLAQAPDFASLMAASANRTSLVSNPWDGPGTMEEFAEHESGSKDPSSSVNDLPSSHLDLPRSLFSQPSLLDNTRSLLSTPSSVSLTHHTSTASLDYVSPTEASRSAEPEPDPWQATIPKLDVALNGHDIVVGRPTSDPPHPGREEQTDHHQKAPKHKELSSAVGESAEAPPKPDTSFLNLERINVTIAPEKGGLVFKHVNYILHSQYRQISVLRRYSDFLWLLDVLVKRYPFRIIPSLPPKKVGADEAFLERRRRGLSRFINMIANHPVLREDEAVIAFLTVEMDIQSFKKKAAIVYDEESLSLNPSTEDLSVIPEDLPERITEFKGNLDFQICQFRDMATLMERIARREDATALDMMRYSLILNKMTEKADCTDRECYNCPRINNGYSQISGGLQRISRVAEEEAQSVFDGIVESLKTYRDLLIACQELFYREERALVSLTLDVLTKRIVTHEAKLRDLQTSKGSTKETERLAILIETDRREVESQRKRIDFIRYCAWQELQFYHKQKAFISLMYQQFVSEKIRLSSHFSEIWRTLATSVFELPTAEFA